MYLTHITTEGERWDQIAYRYYGDPFVYERIIAANPSVPITPRLPSGIALSIPVVTVDDVPDEELPPWLR
ncbi:tail protein X [Burkholderia glumae]|uniref:tail protein X n=1 Tax=Burkholderia glumae TaxID=337 RepID=UPI00039E8ACA|nr:tail protein X [Burkholderia glumae]MCM2494539.1 tail protein X [Burkholderia glumae]